MLKYHRTIVFIFGVFIMIFVADIAAAYEAKSYPVLSGIGIALRAEDGWLCINKIVAESPAERSERLQKGDRLIAVEECGKTTSLRDRTMGEAGSLLRGPVGTELTLTVARPRPTGPAPWHVH